MVNLLPARTLDTNSSHDKTGDIEFSRLDATTWRLRTAQTLPVGRDALFPFFAAAENLGRITPPELSFQILTPTPVAMRAGALIDYRIQLWRVPMRWRTAIAEWAPPVEFVDVQLIGPYSEWVHRHRFTAISADRTLVEDDVRFRLPLGRVGLVAAPLVRSQLRRIFAYRQQAIAQLTSGRRSGNDDSFPVGRDGYGARPGR
ncbi:MAG TPA: SRPBCC family protein [Gemmatimonadaceae bacterium]|jgi:ligand-binding SRPBCC domain-containing protein|nr:SRPBCC family protein [Gemmatimonadaceae bacterium]